MNEMDRTEGTYRECGEVQQRDEFTDTSNRISQCQVSAFQGFSRRQKAETGCLQSLSKRAVEGLGIERDLGMSARPAVREGKPEQMMRDHILLQQSGGANAAEMNGVGQRLRDRNSRGGRPMISKTPETQGFCTGQAVPVLTTIHSFHLHVYTCLYYEKCEVLQSIYRRETRE